MLFKTWDNSNKIKLLDCPFCGAEPSVTHIGNNHTKIRKLIIKCPQCRIKRVDAALKNNFDFLEKVASEQWNNRV